MYIFREFSIVYDLACFCAFWHVWPLNTLYPDVANEIRRIGTLHLAMQSLYFLCSTYGNVPTLQRFLLCWLFPFPTLKNHDNRIYYYY